MPVALLSIRIDDRPSGQLAVDLEFAGTVVNLGNALTSREAFHREKAARLALLAVGIELKEETNV